MGKGRDFVERIAKQAAYNALGQYNTLADGAASGDWFVGDVSEDRSTITDPSSGIVYKLIFTGHIEKHNLARKVSPTTAYALGNAPLRQLTVTSNPSKAYVLEKLTSGTVFMNGFVVKEIQKNIAYSIYPYVMFNDIIGNSDFIGIKFTPDGKSIVAAGQDFSVGGQVTIRWGILNNFSLKTDPETHLNTVEGTLANGSYVLNFNAITSIAAAPDPVFNSSIADPSTGVTSTYIQDLDPVFDNSTSLNNSPYFSDFIIGIDSLGKYKIDIIGAYTSTSIVNKVFTISGFTTPTYFESYSYGGVNPLTGQRTFVVTNPSGSTSGPQTVTAVAVDGRTSPPLVDIWFGPHNDDALGTATGVPFQAYANATNTTRNNGDTDWWLINRNDATGLLSISDLTGVSPILDSKLFGRQETRCFSAPSKPFTNTTAGDAYCAYWSTFTNIDNPNVGFRYQSASDFNRSGFRNIVGDQYAILDGYEDGIVKKSNPYLTSIKDLSDIPAIMTDTHTYYTSDLSLFNNPDYVESRGSESFVTFKSVVVDPPRATAIEIQLFSFSQDKNTIVAGTKVKGDQLDPSLYTLYDWTIRK